ALVSTILATMIGTLAAVGMYRYHFRGKTALDSMLYLPIVIPEIVMGISMLALFAQLNVPLGFWTLVAAHITFSIPFVVFVVKARLDGFDKSIEEAAMDLGATPWQTFIKVTLPVIAPGVIAAALLAFTLSIDDVIISFFVAGPSSATLPLKIFSMVKFGVTPEINALSTLMLLVTLFIAIMAERIRMKKG
ncbi:MAG: ABC transporter permease, partial [Clostridia bacterium]